VLLLRRFNTGWEDGKYSVVAGHVESSESPIGALLREAWEEAGIRIEIGDLEFVHVMHRRKPSGEEKVDLWFACDKWYGTPHNAEPEKCDDLGWFSLENLPPNIVAYVKAALSLISNGQRFSVFYDQTLLHVSGDDSRLRPAPAWGQYL
jgi:8-oxo-dGTP diphosphatase